MNVPRDQRSVDKTLVFGKALPGFEIRHCTHSFNGLCGPCSRSVVPIVGDVTGAGNY
jgi:hypothetical protein